MLYSSVVSLFIMLYKLVLTFKSVDESMKIQLKSNELLPVFIYCIFIIYCVITELRPFKHVDRRCKLRCQSNISLCIAIISRRK